MSTQAIVISSTSSAILAAALILPFIPCSNAAALMTDGPGQQLEELADAVSVDKVERKALSQRLDALLERVVGFEALIEHRRERQVNADATLNSTQQAAPVRTTEATGKKSVTKKEFKALMLKVLRTALNGEASAEEQQRFWEACRNTTFIADSIESLEKAIETSPYNAQLRMELGDTYVAKLLTVPAGPERGIWGMKAEKQWQTVVDNDPNHWDAQYTLAFNYSMYPDFLNKTDDAIKGFERALEIQSHAPQKAQHANTYVHLARMLRKKGDIDKARQLLTQGQALHPQSKAIKTALQSLPGQ